MRRAFFGDYGCLKVKQSKLGGFGVNAAEAIADKTFLCVYSGDADADVFHLSRSCDSSVFLTEIKDAAQRYVILSSFLSALVLRTRLSPARSLFLLSFLGFDLYLSLSLSLSSVCYLSVSLSLSHLAPPLA